jgi:anti-anti-sigma factor
MAILPSQGEYSAEAHGVGEAEVVIEVHGDVDLTSGPSLSSLIAGVVRSGPQRLVIDLSDAGTFGSDGLRVLATARRYASSDLDLMVRSPGWLTQRVLEATGAEQICRIEFA